MKYSGRPVGFLRPQLVTIPGVAIPWPYGGKQRQIMVDLNTRLLQAKGLSPSDVLDTLNLQNLILPSGTAKIGRLEYDVTLNAAPRTVPELADSLADYIQANRLGRVAVLANSFGCQIAADCAARYPELVERLVLVGPTTDPRQRSLVQIATWLAIVPLEPLPLPESAPPVPPPAPPELFAPPRPAVFTPPVAPPTAPEPVSSMGAANR